MLAAMKKLWWLPIPFAAGLRFFDLGGQSYWTDEAISLETASWSWSTLYHYFQVDPHPPLFYLIVRSFVSFGITGEWSLRLISALAGIGAVWCVVWLLHRHFSDSAALAGGLLLAINPLHIWVSQELRGMAMAGFFVCLSISLASIAQPESKGEFSRTRRYVGFLSAICLAAGFYTHYLALFLQPVYLVYNKTTRKIGVFSTIIFLPWLWFIRTQIGVAIAYRQASPWWRNLLETLLYSNAGHFPWHWPTFAKALERPLTEQFWLYVLITCILVCPIWILAIAAGRKSGLIAVWFFVPLGMVLVFARWLPFFQAKYLSIFLPFLPATAGVGFIRLKNERPLIAWGLMAMSFLAPLLNLPDHYTDPDFRKTAWRETLPRLTAGWTERDAIVFYCAQDAAEVRHYLKTEAQLIDLWPEYPAPNLDDLTVLRQIIPPLVESGAERIALVDLNGEMYPATRRLALEWLTRQRGEPAVTELQTAMHIRWLAFGPAGSPSASPSVAP